MLGHVLNLMNEVIIPRTRARPAESARAREAAPPKSERGQFRRVKPEVETEDQAKINWPFDALV